MNKLTKKSIESIISKSKVDMTVNIDNDCYRTNGHILLRVDACDGCSDYGTSKMQFGEITSHRLFNCKLQYHDQMLVKVSNLGFYFLDTKYKNLLGTSPIIYLNGDRITLEYDGYKIMLFKSIYDTGRLNDIKKLLGE